MNTPSHTPRSDEHPIATHAAWTMSLWFPSDRRSPIDSSVFDHAVMGMGLAGETLETLEAVMVDGPIDMDHLKKELGDTLYYWCVSCLRAHLDPVAAWPDGLDFEAKRAESSPREIIERSAIRLAIASGKCSEAFKKIVRDGADTTRLVAALPEMALRWCEMCDVCGFSVLDVAMSNRHKLAGRIARGTLRGDGNDR